MEQSKPHRVYFRNTFEEQPEANYSEQTILSLFSNTYEKQPGERMGIPWLRLWKNA